MLKDLVRRLETVFEARQAEVLVETITAAYNTLVKTSDFSELKAIVAELAAAQQRTEQRVGELVAAQQRTEQRVGELAAAQQRTEQRVDVLAQRMAELVEQVQALVTWQRGEAGRREGERYERLLVKRATALFNGGQGGSPEQPFVQQRLLELLRPLPALDALADDENPFLADLIWWKDNRFVVVEAALQVNGEDVLRAARRSATLQKAAVQALGLVVGEGWVGSEARHQAEARGVQWKVGGDLSDGLRAFLRLSADRV